MASWEISGKFFETCNCETACPCVFLSPPTEGECTGILAWHIEKGHFGDTRLDDLNVALALHAPGTMAETKWRVAAYFDDRADPAQNEALHAIFGGKAGGHPEVLASFIGEMAGAKDVPMRFHSDGNRSSLSIPGIAEAEIERIEGQNGGPVTLEGHPLCVAPGHQATVARSKHFNLNDFGWNWELSGRNGFISGFQYQSEA